MRITPRDREIIRLIHRHRFLRSSHITDLLGGSQQQILRRLQLLYQHSYLERPRAQLEYFGAGGSCPIVYGMSKKGAQLLQKENGSAVSWGGGGDDVGQIFLEHAILVSDVMVAIELACQKRGDIRLLYEDELALPNGRSQVQWQVKLLGGVEHGVVPDRVFALEYAGEKGETERVYYFLEADRGTMPVVRTNPDQTSFQRKLLAYEATWAQKVHQRKLGINRFRVLTVTTSEERVKSLIDACSRLKRGHGLFLFADRAVLEKDPFSPVWQCGKSIQMSALLDLDK